MTKDEIRKKWKNGEMSLSQEEIETQQTQQPSVWQQVMTRTNDIMNKSSEIANKTEEKKKGNAGTWIGKKFGVGVAGGTAGIGQAYVTDVANQLNKGEKKSKGKALLNAVNALTAPNPNQFDVAGLMADTINTVKNAEGENGIQKLANIATNSVGNVVDNMPFKKKTNAVIQAVGSFFKDKNLSEQAINVSDKMQEPIDKWNQKLAEEGQQYGKVANVAGNVAQQIGNMLPSIATKAVTGDASMGLGAMGFSAKGNATREALSKGATLEEAVNIGDAKGLIEVGTELMSDGLNIFKLGGKKATLDVLGDKIVDKAKTKVGKFLLRQGVNVAGEELEEAVSDILGNIIDKGTTDPNLSLDIKDMGKNFLSETALETMLTTTVLNLLPGGMFNDIRTINNEFTIDNSNLSNAQKEYLKELSENNKNIKTEQIEQMINELNAEEEYLSTKIENKPLLQAKQQTTQEEAKLPEKATSQELEENAERTIQDYTNNELHDLSMQNYQEMKEKGLVDDKIVDGQDVTYLTEKGKTTEEGKALWEKHKQIQDEFKRRNEDFSNKVKSGEINLKTTNDTVLGLENGANVDINSELDYNNLNEGEINNEFRRIQEEGSRLSNEERANLYGNDRTKINGIRENIRGLLSKKLEGYFSGNNDSQRTLTNTVTGEEAKVSQVSAEDFHNAFETNRAYMKNPDTVTVHPVEDYKNGKAYLTNDGMSGFFITENGDLQSVFNNSGKAGFLQTIADMVKSDSKTLDCFQNEKQHLGDMYADAFGFKVASIMDFSREVMEEEFGKEYTDAFIEKYGEAPVYFMVNTAQDIETKNFTKDQYDEAKAYQESFVNNMGAQEESSFNLPKNDVAKQETEDENLQTIREANILNEPQNQKVKKSQYAQSVNESKFVNEEAKKKFREAFGDPTYIVKGNKEMINKMSSEIDKYGVEESYNDFVKTYEENTRRMTVEDLIKGQLLLKYYSYAGEIGTEKFNRLDLDLTMLGTELGQAVQSLSIINKDSPEVRLKMLDTAIKRLSKEHNNANLLVSEETRQAIRDSFNDPELLEENMNKAFKEIANQLPKTWLDTMDSWRYLSMLGNPVTLIRNETGNFGNHWLMGAKKIASGALQDLYSGSQSLLVKAGIKNENTFEKTATLKPANKDQRTFAKMDANLMDENIDSRHGNKYTDNSKNEIERQQEMFRSKLVNTWNNLTMTTLDSRDTAYLKWAYQDALQNYMSANNLSSEDFKTDYSVDTGDEVQDRINMKQNEVNAEKLEKARDYACRYACEATFHQFSAVAKAVNKFRNSINETIKSNDVGAKKTGALAVKVGMDATLPFVRTTFNMASQGVEFSPLGLYLSAGKFVNAVTTGNYKLNQQYDNKVSGYATQFANDEISRSEFDSKIEEAKTSLKEQKSQMANNVIESFAKGLTGSAISLIAMAMTKSGMIKVRASDDDKKENKVKNFLNIPEYSIEVGDTAIPIDWLAPVSIPFVIGMYMGKALEDDKDMSTLEKVMVASNASLKGTAGAVTNLSFMEGLLNAFRSYSSDATDNLETLVSNIASGYINQFIPTFFRKANKTVNPRMQDTTSTKKGTFERTMDKTWKNVKAGLPIGEAYEAIRDVTGLKLPEKIDEALEANDTRIDYKGDERSYDENGMSKLLTKQFGDSTGIKVVGRLLDNFVLPSSPNIIRNDDYSKELVRIAEATDDASVIPDVTSLSKDVSINKQSYRLTDKEYNDAQELYGKTSSNLISALMKTDGYKNMSDSDKAEMIDRIYSYAKEEVKANYAKEHGLEFTSTTTKSGVKDMFNTINKIKESGGKAGDYIKYLVGTQKAEGDKEALNYLNSMNVSQSVKNAIYANDLSTKNFVQQTEDSSYKAIQVLNGGKERKGYLEYKQKSKEGYFTNTDEKTGKSVDGQKQRRVRDFLQSSDLSDIEKYYIYAKEGYACVKRGGGLTSKQRQKLRDALNNNKLNIDEEEYNSMMKKLDEADANAKKWKLKD